MGKVIELNTGWEFKQREPAAPLLRDFAAGEWLPASVPGTVHQDLIAAGKIPDPFYGMHELEVQWVGETDWLYRCTFEVGEKLLAKRFITLALDGLDTFATVWLNGIQILTGDNMFLPQRVAVKGALTAGKNELCILFESPLRRGRALENQHGRMVGWNTENSRVYVRKAQYHYGWDWGPVLVTSGIWRAARLEAYDARVADFACPAEVAADLKTATLPVAVEVEARPESEKLEAKISVLDPQGKLAATETVPVKDGIATHTFLISAPEPWYPNGYGSQPLYRIRVELRQKGKSLDLQEKRIGLRRLRLVQEAVAGEPGKSFTFEVNNLPIFCGGANWIPADSFTPRVSRKDYERWLELAQQANMQMLRIWGGGIYEEDVFYDLCDEKGILLWHDFMFACGLYPAHPEFRANVRAEAEAQVRRLRHHPSLALWCGNNEDYQAGRGHQVYDSEFQGDFTKTGFPAREIYERLLPSVVARLDAGRPYWPGSPYWRNDPAEDNLIGDNHIWMVWHGGMRPYQDYPNLMCRFASEFGMQSMVAEGYVRRFVPAEELYPQSPTVEFHNKGGEGTRRVAVYVHDNLRFPSDMKSYIYASQFVQAESNLNAFRAFRHGWGRNGKRACSGALVWQLDDCWPVTSWAIVDYEQRPKPAYYVIRRELAPLTIGLLRKAGKAEVWVVNGRVKAVAGDLLLTAWNLAGEKLTEEKRPVHLAPNQVNELLPISLAEGTVVLSARLLVTGEVVARATWWLEPFKHLTLPHPGIKVQRLKDDRLRLSVERPAKGVVLSAEQDIPWSDNFLDLLPGDAQTVAAPGLGKAKLTLRWLAGEQVGEQEY